MQGGVTQLSRITPAELASHNTREDCWHAYQGKVYNVTPFLKYHPGGVGEMMRAAGKDGAFTTEGFFGAALTPSPHFFPHEQGLSSSVGATDDYPPMTIADALPRSQ